MAVYNLTNMTQANNFLEFAQAINIYSEGTFGIMMYISTLFIMFGFIRLANKSLDSALVLAATLWFAAVFSMLFLIMGFLGQIHVLAAFTLSGLFTMFVYLTNRGQSA